MKIKEKLKTILCILVSISVIAFSSFCITLRAAKCYDVTGTAALLSAFTILPDGKLFSDNAQADSVKEKPKTPISEQQPSESLKISDDNNMTNEATYPISERTLTESNTTYSNIRVKNTTDYTIDFEKLLSEPLDFDIDSSFETQVLIVHTHTCESYMSNDRGYYYESFYPRTTDNSKNVVRVGDEIAKALKSHKIGVIHSDVQHDLTYDGAYDRSFDTIQSKLNTYKNIKVVLDIHRDSMTTEDSTKIKPTFTYNGKKAAQIMIMAGRDDGDGDFPTWRENLKFALRLQKTAESMYPGITRPLYFGDFTYNMNANSGSLLIEIGTDANTLEEAVRTGEMLGNALSQVLQNP